MSVAGQFRRPPARQLDRPPQRRHRVTPLSRVYQGQQRRGQPRIPVPALALTWRNSHPVVVLGMMAKLRARDRAQLVVIAYETGLVRPGLS